MWPEDYPDWAQGVSQGAFNFARNWMIRRNSDPLFQTDIPDLARQAREATFENARGHRGIVGYFADYDAFRFWVLAVVLHQVIRLYLQHPATQWRINALTRQERRLLGMVYVDHLRDSEVARLTGVPTSEVRARADEVFGRV